MSSWQQQTSDIQKLIQYWYSQDNQVNIANLSTQASVNLNDFIKSGSKQGSITNTQEGLNDLNTIETQIIQPLIAKVKSAATNSDLSAKLSQIGSIQQDLLNKKDQLQKAKQDADASQARDSLLRSQGTDITRDKIFLLGRPIKKSSIPYLWMASALFFFLAITFLILGFPQTPTDPFGLYTYGRKLQNTISTTSFGQYAYGPSLKEQFVEIATSRFAYILYGVSILMIIIMLSLKAAGVLK